MQRMGPTHDREVSNFLIGFEIPHQLEKLWGALIALKVVEKKISKEVCHKEWWCSLVVCERGSSKVLFYKRGKD